MLLLDPSGQIPDTQIALVTRLGNAIDNTQSWQLTTLDWNPVSLDAIKSFGRALRLTEACPVYNCHGLTFGSRRTSVTHDVNPILQQDGFTEVSEADAREGDVVVYYIDGIIEHTGFVIGREHVIGNVTRLRIWSKWNRGPEMSHPAQECPYFRGEENLKYYRLTEWVDSWRNIAL